MKEVFYIPFSFSFVVSFSQTQEKKDSIVNLICDSISKIKNEPDSQRFLKPFFYYFNSFAKEFPQTQKEKLFESIYFRLQRNCIEAKVLLAKVQPPKGDWKSVSEKPKIKLEKMACDKFLKHVQYFYLESNGDTVHLQIKNGYWIDSFEDGTYSKLKFTWLKNCEFELSFIKSNNRIRRNFSKHGDLYKYQVLNKNDNYYDMSVEIAGSNKFTTFKIYFTQ
jgi:hypothetical protein